MRRRLVQVLALLVYGVALGIGAMWLVGPAPDRAAGTAGRAQAEPPPPRARGGGPPDPGLREVGVGAIRARGSRAVAPPLADQPGRAGQAVATAERTVRGVVTDRDGAPLREGAVNGQSFLFDGRFELTLPPGAATLRVTAPGFVAREVSLGEARPQELEIALDPARRVAIWVLAADTGRPVIPFHLQAEGPGFHEERDVLDPAGQCVLDAPADPLAIRIRAEPTAGYVGWEGDERQAGRVVLERGARLSGRIVGGAGEPLTGIPRSRVTVIGAGHPWARQETETDADGGFTLTGIAPDEALCVLAHCPALDRSSSVSVSWHPPGTSQVRVPVYPAGRIVLRDGPPAGPVSLEAGQLPPEVRPPPVVIEQQGSPTWVCSRLAPGIYTVRWEGRPVGTVELPARADGPSVAQVTWPGDPQEVRAAWERWAAAQRAAPAVVAPVRSAERPRVGQEGAAGGSADGGVATVGSVVPLGLRRPGLTGAPVRVR